MTQRTEVLTVDSLSQDEINFCRWDFERRISVSFSGVAYLGPMISLVQFRFALLCLHEEDPEMLLRAKASFRHLWILIEVCAGNEARRLARRRSAPMYEIEERWASLFCRAFLQGELLTIASLRFAPTMKEFEDAFDRVCAIFADVPDKPFIRLS